jgi:hypothetical protein
MIAGGWLSMDRFDNPKRGPAIHFAPITLPFGINRAYVAPIAVV